MSNRQERKARRKEAQQPPQPQAVTRVSREITQHSGPLPAPEDLERYGQVVPDGAERIMRMAENEAKHRQALEASLHQEEFGWLRRGQWMGFVIALAGFATSAWLGFAGSHWSAGVLGTGTLLSLVTVFVLGRRR